MGEKKAFKKFPKKQHIKNDTPSVQEGVEEVYDDGRVLLKEKPHRNGRHPVSFYGAGKIRMYAMSVFALFFMIFLTLLLFPIPFGQIQISGTRSITLEDVLFEGNVSTPINILQISTADLEERLTHDIRIQTVRVKRSSPFTISVEITDRKVVAVMQGEYAYIFLDKEGTVVQTEPSIKGMVFPMITGKKLGNVLLGDKLDDAQIHTALEFINGLTEDGIKIFSEVNVGNTDNLMAYTRGGISVHLKNGTDMEKKAALAESMVNDVKARGLSVEYLDANLAAPFIKLKR